MGIDRFSQRGLGSVEPEETQAGGQGWAEQFGKALSPLPCKAMSPIRGTRSLVTSGAVCVCACVTVVLCWDRLE